MRVSLKVEKMAVVKLAYSEELVPAGKLKVGDFVDTQWGLRPVIRLEYVDVSKFITEPFGV